MYPALKRPRQNPRHLQLNATSHSTWQPSHRTRGNPYSSRRRRASAAYLDRYPERVESHAALSKRAAHDIANRQETVAPAGDPSVLGA